MNGRSRQTSSFQIRLSILLRVRFNAIPKFLASCEVAKNNILVEDNYFFQSLCLETRRKDKGRLKIGKRKGGKSILHNLVHFHNHDWEIFVRQTDNGSQCRAITSGSLQPLGLAKRVQVMTPVVVF